MRSAFTLIELALVLVIVSLMTGFGLQAFESTSGVNCVSSTQEQLKTIDRSLQNYAAAHSRYPKPARMDLGSNNPQFGYEGTDGSATPPTDPAFITIVPTGVTNASGTLIGSLPHVALGLPASYASDCWGSKFTYAVANSQTGSDPNVGFRSAALGNIELRTGNLSSSQSLSPNISYVVVSHGEDKYGATPMSAGNPAARNCNGSTAGKIDRHNCDSDPVFFSAMVNTGDGNNYFDDLMVYSSKIQSTEDCPDQNVNWSPSCSGMSGVVLHGTTATVGSTAPNYWVGNTQVRCDDGVLTQTGVLNCEQQTPCSATTLTWNNSGAAGSPCSAAVGSRNHNQSHSNVPNATGGYTGSVTAQCVNGSFTNYSGVSCTPNPCSGSQSWGPGNGCTGSVSNLASGSTQAVANTNTAQFSGSANFLCTTGTLSISGTPTCTSVTNPCSAGSVSWGSGCSAAAAAMVHAAPAQSVSNSAGGYSGSANVTCNNGTLSAAGTCFANCSARSETWSSCSGSTPAITHGSASSVSNTASGYTGAVTMSCTNGSLSQSGASCIADPPPAIGHLYCWGQDSTSRFGNGNSATTNHNLPLLSANLPAGVTGWKAVSTSYFQGCAIGTNDQAYCWALGTWGGIGNNTSSNATVPTLVTRPGGVANWSKITSGQGHNCAIGSNNQAYCWGMGDNGALGNGDTNNRAVPTLVTNPSGVTGWLMLSGGNRYTCGIGSNSQAYCWGFGSQGVLGYGGSSDQSTPALVVNPNGVTSWSAIHAGNNATCGIGNNGQAYCWGLNNLVGNGSTSGQTNVPVAVTNPSGVTSWTRVAASLFHVCGIGNNGRAYCWGSSSSGQVGDNTTGTSYYTPQIVTNPGGVTSWTRIMVGELHTCGLANNGRVYCWGRNTEGQVGNGANVQRNVPTAVTLPSNVSQWGNVFAAHRFSCATAVGGGCISDGGASGGVTGNCCNGDPDANNVCGTQPGTCGAASGASHLNAPSSSLCSSGVAGAVSGSMGNPWAWTCSGTSCTAGRSCAAYTHTWGTGCTTPIGQDSTGSAGGYGNTNSAYTGLIYISCTNGVRTVTSSTCQRMAVCGSAQGATTAVAPSSGLCSVGTASAVSGSMGNPFTWTCTSDEGHVANCQVQRACTGTATWMTNCSKSMPLTGSGTAGGPHTNTAAGYTGSASIVSCMNGIWGFPSTNTCTAVAGCAAGWSKVYHFSDEASYDCRSYDNTIGLCTSGEGGTSASSRGNTNTCIMPGSCVDARQCGCVGNGATVPNHGYGPQPQLCCNGDSDGNGVCGTQTAVVNGACRAHPGTHASQPATNTATGCTAGTYADIGDTGTDWQWNCVGSGGGTTAGCGASRPVTCTDECGVTRNDGQIWCPPTGYGGVGDGSRCSSGTITQEYNPSCNNPQPCSGGPTWQYFGEYTNSPDVGMATMDMDCGGVMPSPCAGCTPFGAMSSCVDGGDCTGTLYPDCLMNYRTCAMSSGGTAHSWDRYRCQ